MGRNADADSALGSALVGFAPTPDFPEVNEPVAFLASRLVPGRGVSRLDGFRMAAFPTAASTVKLPLKRVDSFRS